MRDDNAHIYVEFHDEAKKIFFTHLSNFQASSNKINRDQREKDYGQLKDRYVNTLKQDLESCALNLISKHKADRYLDSFNQGIQNFIKNYLHLFVQKIKSY